MSTGKIIICCHVKFIETEFLFSKLHKPQQHDYDPLDVNSLSHHFHYSTSPSVGREEPDSNGPSPAPSSAPSSSIVQSSPPPDSAPSSSPDHPRPVSSQPTPSIIPSPENSQTTQPIPISHPMTTRAKHGIYKPNPRYFHNLHTTSISHISPIPMTL
ncbi:unnamed protein product [Cuscuta europaea]|uniref:Uncharacterized protein n=1 Tax=Cuscuta europaea TaxID=41803 RepID=A0A9P0ZC10_CUSEU|nr:unnamed protein product [Cuscuta europaea]